jgi:LAO/AO transport system kinase
MDIINDILNGSPRAVARLMTLVEQGDIEAYKLLSLLYPYTGNAYVVGITGPPGSGKSTIIDKLALELCKRNYSLGILAIDPSSPFSGGALLGDRVRMQAINKNKEIFIRSLSTRGSSGGLSKATLSFVNILDAMGKDVILIETVGVGQDEVDITKTADTSLVVLVPGLGDEIQTFKSGIMEIADIFIINKSDKEGTNQLAREIQLLLELDPKRREWISPIVHTIATKSVGITKLLDRVFDHREFISKNSKIHNFRKKKIKSEIINLLEDEIKSYIDILIDDFSFENLVEEIFTKKKDPYSGVKEFLKPIFSEFKKEGIKERK